MLQNSSILSLRKNICIYMYMYLHMLEKYTHIRAHEEHEKHTFSPHEEHVHMCIHVRKMYAYLQRTYIYVYINM